MRLRQVKFLTPAKDLRTICPREKFSKAQRALRPSVLSDMGWEVIFQSKYINEELSFHKGERGFQIRYNHVFQLLSVVKEDF